MIFGDIKPPWDQQITHFPPVLRLLHQLIHSLWVLWPALPSLVFPQFGANSDTNKRKSLKFFLLQTDLQRLKGGNELSHYNSTSVLCSLNRVSLCRRSDNSEENDSILNQSHTNAEKHSFCPNTEEQMQFHWCFSLSCIWRRSVSLLYKCSPASQMHTETRHHSIPDRQKDIMKERKT